MKLIFLTIILCSCSPDARFTIVDERVHLTQFESQSCREVERKYLCADGKSTVFIDVTETKK